MINYSSVCFLWILCTTGFPKDYLRAQGVKHIMPFPKVKRVLLYDMFGQMKTVNWYALSKLTGIALLGSSPFMNCTFTVMLRAEPWRLAKFRLCGSTYSRFLHTHTGRQRKRNCLNIKSLMLLFNKTRLESNFVF